jgi:hypothetical protein
MSSVYRYICLSHDPSIIIENIEYSDFDTTTGAILNKTKIHNHATCDLIVGRWSGGLVELVCPSCNYHGSSYQKWVSKDWVLLLKRSIDKQVEVPRGLYRCWTAERVERMATLLEES